MSNPSLTNYISGYNQVSGDMFNTFCQTCSTVAQLRAFAGNNTAISVYVRGTSVANDGGQGTFYWSTATGTDDNGITTIVPSGVTSGCWVRQPVSSNSTLLGTSTTSSTIGAGTKIFTLAAVTATISPGIFVIISSQANSANYMAGQVVSYNSGVLNVNVTSTGGSGTLAAWNVSLSGVVGASGATPSFNNISSGTNTTATMVVGSGSSLTPTGTGAIQASALSSTIASQVTYTKAQSGAIVTLTDGVTITPDFSLGNNFAVTLAGNRTLANPTNITQGQNGQISIYQDSTGSRSLAYGWGWWFVNQAIPTPSTAGLSTDELCYDVLMYNTGTATITIATPAVITWTAHGMRSGSKVQLTTTGALPTGLNVSTTYFAIVIDANTFNLATSLVNAASGTAIATSGSQSGVHTATTIEIHANLAKGFA